ncbi:phage/plasmid primase, P4 family [Dactylosporangium maewongense]|uniref:Phage/plasmid primase, P4 family n=1 Tax=Dactylosporangium maewongense TaxID=634393 RepID=A0ABP4PAB4_9ACTN
MSEQDETAPRLPHAWGATEDGLAQALAHTHGHELRFCPQRGTWLRWTGHRWVWDEAEQHRELIRALARELPTSSRWRRFRQGALSAGGVSGVARLARSDPRLVVELGQVDAHPYELNTPGGIANLQTGELHAADPQRLHTRSSAVTPDFERRAEVWERFLTDTFGEGDALRIYVQRLLGISALGAVLEQILPFALGAGANGKSTLLEASMHALGLGGSGYAIAASSELLMQRQFADHPTELAQLHGARLVVCSELSEGARFSEGRVKQLTGRDSIPARYMRGNWFSFAPSHTLWLLGNHRPEVRTGGLAFWRRVRLIPFTRTLSEDRQDRRLGERLAEEAPAVLAWIIRGAVDYHRYGLPEPAAVRAATAAYARDEDTVARFVAECCHLAADQPLVRVATTRFRRAYERWCQQTGDAPVTAKRLTQDLERQGVRTGRGTGGARHYVGVSLLLAEDDAENSDDRRGTI